MKKLRCLLFASIFLLCISGIIGSYVQIYYKRSTIFFIISSICSILCIGYLSEFKKEFFDEIFGPRIQGPLTRYRKILSKEEYLILLKKRFKIFMICGVAFFVFGIFTLGLQIIIKEIS